MEVRVGVHADEVACVDGGSVGAVDPGGPGVDVADGDLVCDCGREGGADLADVAGDGVWCGAGVHFTVLLGDGAHAVEVLASDGDAGDLVDEGLAVLGDCVGEGGEFIVEDGVAGGGPEAEEKGCVGVERGGDGGDGRVGGAALDGGEEAGAVVAGGALEGFGGVEGGFVVRLLFYGSIGEGGAVVEALVGGRG